MVPSIKELVDRQDWEGIRDNWNEIRCHVAGEDGYVTVCNSIKSVLCRGSDDFPLDIFKRLFRKRWEMIRSIPAVRRTLKEWTTRTGFHEQLYEWICCGCPFEIVNRLPIQVLEMILNEHEIHFGGTDKLGARDAAWIICKMWTPALMAADENLLSIPSVLTDLSKDDNDELCDLWERTVLFIRHRKPKSSPLLHCAVMGGCPLIIVGLIAKIYSDQLYQLDGRGRIPLHYASQSPIRIENNFCDEFWMTLGVDDNDHSSFTSHSYVRLLLQEYPQGARFADAEGTLPFVMYLETTCPGSNSHGRGAVFHDQCRADMDEFISAAPETLTTRDMATHQLPFMIPSARCNDDDGHTCISLTYEMLQQNPAALNIFIDHDKSLDSFHVKQLRKRHMKETIAHGKKVAKLEGTLQVASDTISKQQEEIERLRALVAAYESGAVPMETS